MLIAAIVTACAAPQAPSVPTAAPTDTSQPPTATFAPSATLRASPTSQVTVQPPTPSATPTEIATAKPTAAAQPTPLAASPKPSRLIFPTTDGLMSVAADGTDKQVLGPVRLEFARTLRDALSPRGDWIAFVSGDDPAQSGNDHSDPMMLNVLDISTDQITPITPLFSDELAQAIKAASATGDRTDAIEAEIAIIDNADTLKWSPDGRYLAFIAAIDGPSSDVYSYDRETAAIHRLTDGPNQAARLFWSPDSQWIVHEEVAAFGTGAGWAVRAVWAAAADGSGNRKLYDVTRSGDEVFGEWLTPDTFLVHSWTPIGWRNARVVNFHDGQTQLIAPEFPVQTLAYDPQSQAQLYFGDDYTLQQQGLQGGLYLAQPNAADPAPRFIAAGDWYETRWLPHVRLFFARGRQGMISVALDGRVTKYVVGQTIPIESPNGAWLLGWSYGETIGGTGLRLYTPDGDLTRLITSEPVLLATWSPDSVGAFYVSKGALYYLAIPDGDPQFIADKLISAELASFAWIPR